nr:MULTISPECIES: FkbM family methyltransferase [unclassified Mycolicibacterium]
MVDVGAHFGTVTAEFLKLNWSVVAYEPDPSNRKEFERRVGGDPRVQLSTSGVSDKPAEHVSLFTSPVSTGVSTLSPFHESHEATTHVDLVTLAEDLRARKVQNVDFLKVDIEGFDFFALKGFDWSYNPRFVLYEFEDRKTVPLGYSVADSSAYVRDLGYHVVYSVWEPIVEYGTAHRWRGLYTDPPADIAKCWGNVLAFRDQQDVSRCLSWYGSLPRRILGSLRRG